MNLKFERAGVGQRMLLLHGIGHRRQMWLPVMDRLISDFDVVALDLPGFGDSPALPSQDMPTPVRLTDAVEGVLDTLGWPDAHLVGNSLGAWICLELARRSRALSVCGLMPAGLWRPGAGSNSIQTRALFRIWNGASRLPFADAAVRIAVVRTAVQFGLFGRPWRVPADVASGDSRNMRIGDFARTMAALEGRRFTGGQDIRVPVTVAFGSRDPLIRSRRTVLTDLPPSTTVLNLRRVGHVPTWDDPDLVATTIRRAAGKSD